MYMKGQKYPALNISLLPHIGNSCRIFERIIKHTHAESTSVLDPVDIKPQISRYMRPIDAPGNPIGTNDCRG